MTTLDDLTGDERAMVDAVSAWPRPSLLVYMRGDGEVCHGYTCPDYAVLHWCGSLIDNVLRRQGLPELAGETDRALTAALGVLALRDGYQG